MAAIAAIFLTLFLCLTLPCLAAAPLPDRNPYNLIDPDILNWTIETSTNIDNYVSSRSGNLAQIRVQTDDVTVGENTTQVGVLLTTTIPNGFLISGQSYVFSFYVPTNAEIWNPGTGSLKSQYLDTTCVIQIGSFGSEYNVFQEISITQDNVEGLQGHNVNLSFTCPDYNGTIKVALWMEVAKKTTNQQTRYTFWGRYFSLISQADFDRIQQYNTLWYGNTSGDYSNPFTTESYDVGIAGDTSNIDSGLNSWDSAIDEFSTPVRLGGVFLESLFGSSGIAIIGILVLCILMFGVVFRLLGVT